jgi:hypothetical protein
VVNAMPQLLYLQKTDLVCIVQETGWASGPGFKWKENVEFAVTCMRNHASEFHYVIQGYHPEEEALMRIFTHN